MCDRAMKQLQLLVAIIPLLIVATLSNVYASGPRLDVPEDKNCIDIDCLK